VVRCSNLSAVGWEMVRSQRPRRKGRRDVCGIYAPGGCLYSVWVWRLGECRIFVSGSRRLMH